VPVVVEIGAKPALSGVEGAVQRSEASNPAPETGSRATNSGRRMLAVTQFFEDDDMAFVLDRMLSRQNPMRARLNSGRYFVRFVAIEDSSQRRSICAALNQWIASSSEKVTGIGAHFASSLEMPEHNLSLKNPSANAETIANPNGGVKKSIAENSAVKTSMPPSVSTVTAPQLDSGAAANIHCPSPFPSGF
jgi:hypothetical protein